MAACKRCGQPAGFMSDTCGACIAKEDAARKEKFADGGKTEQERNEQMRVALRRIKCVTTESIEGRSTVESIDVISAECVFGMNLFKDFMAGLSDIFGGRSETTQQALRDARLLCLDELRAEAYRLGADAVVGVRLDYSEMSGGGKSMLFLVASGTAVKLSES